MMIVGNHHNQLKEAHRVLREGGVAGFTVWGRREHSAYFNMIHEAIKEAGVELPKLRSHFHLGGDPAQLIADAKKAGFKRAVTWFQPSYSNILDAEGFFAMFAKGPTALLIS